MASSTNQRDLDFHVSQELIDHLQATVRQLNYAPSSDGKNTVTPMDIAFRSGQEDMLIKLRNLQERSNGRRRQGT